MKKSFISALTIITCAFSWLHAEQYVNEKLSVQTNFPEGWKVTEQLNQAMAIFTPQEESKDCCGCCNTVSVVLFATPAEEGFADTIEEFGSSEEKESLRQEFVQAFSFLGLSAGDYTLSSQEIFGKKAIYVTMNMDWEDKVIKTEFYLFPHHDLLYVLQYSAEEAKFEEYHEGAQSIMNQLHFFDSIPLQEVE